MLTKKNGYDAEIEAKMLDYVTHAVPGHEKLLDIVRNYFSLLVRAIFLNSNIQLGAYFSRVVNLLLDLRYNVMINIYILKCFSVRGYESCNCIRNCLKYPDCLILHSRLNVYINYFYIYTMIHVIYIYFFFWPTISLN